MLRKKAFEIFQCQALIFVSVKAFKVGTFHQNLELFCHVLMFNDVKQSKNNETAPLIKLSENKIKNEKFNFVFQN